MNDELLFIENLDVINEVSDVISGNFVDDDIEDFDYPDFDVTPKGGFYGATIVEVDREDCYEDGSTITIEPNCECYIECDDYGEYVCLFKHGLEKISIDKSKLTFVNDDGCEYYIARMPKLDSTSTVGPTAGLVPTVEVVTGDIVESPQEIHERICNNFDIVEKTLYEICVDLKTIRDNKYYKQLGYDSFEEYCSNCFSLSRMSAYRFISIAENLSNEFVTSRLQIGVKKLYCLSRLTNEQRVELMDSTDIEKATVKEVESKAKEIKGESKPQQVALADSFPDGAMKFVDSVNYVYNDLGGYLNASINLKVDEINESVLSEALKNMEIAKTYAANMSKALGNLIKLLKANDSKK